MCQTVNRYWHEVSTVRYTRGSFSRIWVDQPADFAAEGRGLSAAKWPGQTVGRSALSLLRAFVSNSSTHPVGDSQTSGELPRGETRGTSMDVR